MEVEIPLITTQNTLNLCNGDITVSVVGNFVGLIWSTGQNGGNAIQVSQPGTISVTGQDLNGCPAASQDIEIIETVPPPLTTVPVAPITICGNSATVTASAGFVSYSWSNGATTISTTVNMPGIISVSATDNNGCTVSSGPINIVTGSSVAVPVEPAVAAICDGVPATLSAGDGFTNYEWSNGATGQEITVSSTGFYSVTATDDNGCPGSSPLVEVISSQFPISNFSYTQNAGGYTVNFDNQSQNGLEYEWTFDSIGTSPLPDPSFTFPEYGPYYVTLIITNPCGSDTIEKLIVVTPVGIEDVSSGAKFALSPNPADEYFILRGTTPIQGILNLRMFDSSGRIVSTEQFPASKDINRKFDISSLMKGLYIIEIQPIEGASRMKLFKK
ncbi:MAG: T9SS type A sorting domain-containing protein [Bacteroidia bacterium]